MGEILLVELKPGKVSVGIRDQGKAYIFASDLEPQEAIKLIQDIIEKRVDVATWNWIEIDLPEGKSSVSTRLTTLPDE